MNNFFVQRLITFAFAIGLVIPHYACTIFVLTDSKRTLFFNNEDFSNPATRVWFLPGDTNYYGVAYFGFDNDWAQGGVNTAGLAFDWVAGYEDPYVPDQHLLGVRGNNPSQRMLESCATIHEAIAFYRKYREPAFSNARVMIADRTGASVIIGSQDGKLYFDQSNQSRGFGYGEKTLNAMLAKTAKPTLQNGLPILQACTQKGEFATKYSSIYDLRSGDISIIAAGQQHEIKLNLLKELAKGAHYYDIPKIDTQHQQTLQPLRPAMKRFIADGYTPIVPKDSAVNTRFKMLVEHMASGDLDKEEFSPELWKQIEPNLKSIQMESQQTGKITSIQLVEKKEINKQRQYLYLIEFEWATVVQRFVVDEHNRIAIIQPEGWEPKSK